MCGSKTIAAEPPIGGVSVVIINAYSDGVGDWLMAQSSAIVAQEHYIAEVKRLSSQIISYMTSLGSWKDASQNLLMELPRAKAILKLPRTIISQLDTYSNEKSTETVGQKRKERQEEYGGRGTS
ncbi:hypothetical protein KL907_003909 [Ogataea polymorpha]|nr:hypothetical protein KL937_003272 [Ogataea polymorpha]KAG7902776.1 hypothetical protein KL907_003909 [Ogataea polymorpha]KAG7935119.1 hypothetical protein KL904_003451 [Ogataea polymorpha]